MKKAFDYNINYAAVNIRKHPELYRIGKGEQGVLLVEPYKSEILPYWRFRTPTIAKQSSEKIFQLFRQYKKNKDFIGMDMARKYLQMGITRSLRYYHHKSGKKYMGAISKNKNGTRSAHPRPELPKDLDFEKKKCAEIFRQKYLLVMSDQYYVQQRNKFRKKYG